MPQLTVFICTTILLGVAAHAHVDVARPPRDYNRKSSRVPALMQQVLCRNFPDVPCDLITSDARLKSLIDLSIREIENKQNPPRPGNVFHHKPAGGNTNNNYSGNQHKIVKKKRKKLNSNILQRKMISGNNKKMSKFFPQKINYNESNERGSNSGADVYSGKNDFLWKIDYSKHGEPSFSEGGNNYNKADEGDPRRKYVMKPNVLIKKRLRPDAADSAEA